jgi:hypothetical protein
MRIRPFIIYCILTSCGVFKMSKKQSNPTPKEVGAVKPPPPPPPPKAVMKNKCLWIFKGDL